MQLAHGATALTESWQAYDDVSNNHFMLGHLMEWLYAGLAGLSQTDESVGFRTLKVDPQYVVGINHASASHVTPYGEARVAWRRGEGNTTIDVTVPANSQAEVWLPPSQEASVTEYGKPLSPDCVIKRTPEKICVLIGSGDYRFEIN